jgi:hypothetical protein
MLRVVNSKQIIFDITSLSGASQIMQHAQPTGILPNYAKINYYFFFQIP